MDYVNVDTSGFVHDVDEFGDVTHLHLLSSVLPVLDCWTFHSTALIDSSSWKDILTASDTNTWQQLDAMQKKIPG